MHISLIRIDARMLQLVDPLEVEVELRIEQISEMEGLIREIATVGALLGPGPALEATAWLEVASEVCRVDQPCVVTSVGIERVSCVQKKPNATAHPALRDIYKVPNV